ncbi:MAG: hypothetical protein IPH78_09595 [Bacteroidetes bacterium]|nr:hypothetical protein [Bacteroidota bacterium]
MNSVLDKDLYFEIEAANGSEDKTRYYIRSIKARTDVPWLLFRKIALPRISYVSILKLKNNNNEVNYYFRLFIDYQYNATNHPAKIKSVEKAIEKSGLSEAKKENIYQARKGQGKFRSELLDQMQVCPFTQVTDERILLLVI